MYAVNVYANPIKEIEFSYDIETDVVMSASCVNNRNRLPPSNIVCLASTFRNNFLRRHVT